MNVVDPNDKFNLSLEFTSLVVSEQMNLKQLYHFQLVAEELNYHVAAEKANLSQPAMSHSIKTLETEYGQQLFDRSHRTVRLTPFGEGVLNFANRLLFEAGNFETGVQNLRSGVAGHLSLSMATTVAENFGGKALSEFSKEYPNISFSISVYNSAHILDRLNADLDHFAICDQQTAALRKNISVDHWAVQHGGFFCRPDHPILRIGKPSFKQAHSYGFTSLNVTPTIHSNFEGELGIDGTLVRLMHMTSDNIKMCRDVCIASDNILIAEVDNIQEDVDAGILVQLDLGFGFTRNLCIATKTDHLLPKAATTMIEYLQANQATILAN